MKKEQETKREQEAGIGDFGGALIVRDPSLKLNEQWELPEFVRWLREEGFRQAFYKVGLTELTGYLSISRQKNINPECRE